MNGKKSVKEGGSHLLYYLLQYTWGLPQNLVGGVLYLSHRYHGAKQDPFPFHGARVLRWKHSGSMGMGMFIFLGTTPGPFEERILVHEFGHTIQSVLLGPLFLPVIGLPSLIWAQLPCFERLRSKGEVSYFDFYPEKWADHCGERFTGRSVSDGKEKLKKRKKVSDKL